MDFIDKITKHINIPNDIKVSEQVIKDSYRYMAKLYHLDRNNSLYANSKMADVNESYEWLIEHIFYIDKYWHVIKPRKHW